MACLRYDYEGKLLTLLKDMPLSRFLLRKLHGCQHAHDERIKAPCSDQLVALVLLQSVQDSSWARGEVENGWHQLPAQVIVDGWGRVIQQPEQLQYLKKLEFIPFKVPAPSSASIHGATP